MWECEESLPAEIKSAWEAGAPVHDLGDLANALQRIMESLKRWSHEKFGAVTSELEKLRKRLEELNGQDPGGN
jgi:hypothetical protein